MNGIMTLLRGEFRHHASSWLALFAGMVACGAGCGLSFAMMAAGAGDASAAGDSGGTALAMAVMSTISVSASLAGLICRERQPQVAIWKLAGMGPWELLTLVLGQVLVVAAAGALVGALVAMPLVPGFLAPFAAMGLDVHAGRIGADQVVGVVRLCSLSAALGAVGPAVALARLRPMKVLGQSAAPKARPTIAGSFVSVVLLGSWGFLFRTDPAELGNHMSAPSMALGLQLILLLAVLPVMPVLIRVLLQWTRLLDLLGPIPRVAGRNLRHRSAFTVALEVPWFLAMGTIVGLGGVLMAVLNRLGGTADNLDLLVRLMLPALVPAALGGVASLLILRPRAMADGVSLRHAGASEAQRLQQLMLETAATVLTVGMTVLAFTVVGVVVTNHLVVGSYFPAGWVADLMLPQLGLMLAVMTLVVALVQLATSASTRPQAS